MGTKTGGLRCTEMYGGDFLLCYCKRVIYRTYFLLSLVHRQFVRGSFFETGEVSEWQSYGIGSEKRYYMLRNAANAVLCVNITKYVKMTGHWNRRYLWERTLYITSWITADIIIEPIRQISW